jgi:hypothetical protein
MNQMNSITFVLFSKYYPIVDQLGSKDSSRDFQLNYVISYFLPTFNTLCKRLKINVMEREGRGSDPSNLGLIIVGDRRRMPGRAVMPDFCRGAGKAADDRAWHAPFTRHRSQLSERAQANRYWLHAWLAPPA